MGVPRRPAALAAAVCALVAVAAAARPAAARRWEEMRGAGAALMYVRHDRALEPERAGADQIALGLAARLLWGRRLAWAAGVDFDLGASLGGGFVYEFDLYPLGVGLRLGRSLSLGVAAGAGLGGVVHDVPFAWLVPVEAALEADLGPHVHVTVLGRAAFVFGSTARQGGAGDAPFGLGPCAPRRVGCDELAAGVRVRWNRRTDHGYVRSGSGYFLGATFRAQLGARFVGVVLGFAVAAATR